MAISDRTAAVIAAALSTFGAQVTARLRVNAGEQEDQLRGPLQTFLAKVGEAFNLNVIPVGEARLQQLRSRPDYAVYVNDSVVGYLEVKAPDKRVDPNRFRGHDRLQWERLRALPNLAYTNGSTWALYHFGTESLRSPVACRGDLWSSGASLSADIGTLAELLEEFLLWEPDPPRTARQLAKSVAGLCRLLRDEVTATLAAEAYAPVDAPRPFTELANHWRELLFPGASDDRFADSYAQTITFALLMARKEGVVLPRGDLGGVGKALEARHGLLGRALQVLTDTAMRRHVETSVSALVHVIGAVDWTWLERTGNPWRFFYEDFLAVYNPTFREEAGAYYTPPAVVETQVRLIEELLDSRLGRPLGFANPDVVTLDPAMGTGSYLIEVIDRTAENVKHHLSPSAVPLALHDMATNLIGFEVMASPFAVAEVSVGAAFRRWDTDPPLRLYLADTLSDPYAAQAQLGGIYDLIARSRREADRIKITTPVLICLGNPPWDRHGPSKQAGGWVRYGNPALGHQPILNQFRSRDPEISRRAVNLYNLYVYFWCWALWKVFEAHRDDAHGIVSFITPASFADGPGFAEMRAHMRRVADEIWIINLTPEGHQPPIPTRIFPGVQVQICITILLRDGEPDPARPAQVHTVSIAGSQDEKFAKLRRLTLDAPGWEPCQNGWHDPFAPEPTSEWTASPALLDLMPWSSPGVKTERTWVIAPQQGVLRNRWRQLVAAPLGDRSRLLKANRNRKIYSTPRPLPGYGDPNSRMAPLASAKPDEPVPPIRRYGYRSFDRQWILADHRLMYPARPDLWAVAGPTQIFLTTQHAHELRSGPAVVATADIPDNDYFQGHEGGAVLPLWRDGRGTKPNILPGLLEYLRTVLQKTVTPAQFIAYLAGILGHRGYTRRFANHLRPPGPRVPLTTDPELFDRAVQLGSTVLWLHTYATRYVDSDAGRPKSIPRGRARPDKPIPPGPQGMPTSARYHEASQTLHVGAGTFTPVSPAVVGYEVNGMRVVFKWLNYRLADPVGVSSSPLSDDIKATEWSFEWTLELLNLLWVLEALTNLEPAQEELLDRIILAPRLSTGDLQRLAILPAPLTARTASMSSTDDTAQPKLSLTDE